MARPGWLNDNEFREFPFVPGKYLPAARIGPLLPSAICVDAVFLLGVTLLFDDKYDLVYLQSLQRDADGYHLIFANTVTDRTLKFSLPTLDVEWVTLTAAAAPIDSPQPSDVCLGEPSWEGRLTIGRPAELAELLPTVPSSVDFHEYEWRIEPTRVQNLARSYVERISLANADRTHWQPPDECQGSSAAPVAMTIIPQRRCMTGHLRLKEGFNCDIRQDEHTRTFTIGAVRGGGDGVACAEVPLYSDEQPPPGSRVLSGGPTCTEIIKTINGVGGRIIQLVGGAGVQVVTDPESPHTINVNVTLRDFAYCPESA